MGSGRDGIDKCCSCPAHTEFLIPEFRAKNTHYICSFVLRRLRSIVFRMSSCFLVRATTREI